MDFMTLHTTRSNHLNLNQVVTIEIHFIITRPSAKTYSDLFSAAMDSNTNRKENKIDASTRTRQNESDIDDFSTVDTKKEVGETDSGREHVWSEPKSGITYDYSGEFLPQTTVECKGTKINDVFGPRGMISPTKTLRNFLSCIDPSSFHENECNAGTVVPQLDSLHEREGNSVNILAPVFSQPFGFKRTSKFDFFHDS